MNLDLTLFSGYILDTNTIIELGRRIRPPELRRTATAIVDNLIQQGRIMCPQEVFLELSYRANDAGDEVLQWARARKTIFADMNDRQQEFLASVLEQYPGIVKYNDLGGYDADPILIAMAMDAPNWTVVTRDGFGKVKVGEVKVKQVCDSFSIPCKTEFDMLKENGWGI